MNVPKHPKTSQNVPNLFSFLVFLSFVLQNAIQYVRKIYSVSVSLLLEAALAVNATASTSLNNSKNAGSADGGGNVEEAGIEPETKNKRQIEQFLGSPGASVAASLGYDADPAGPQAYPLQLTHAIYDQQQRLLLYTRRPTGNSKSPSLSEDDAIEQEQQLQQQQQQQVCFQ